ncbi:MAG: hypothetical protein K6E13_03310 [Lachnospiraceae bacterium]|nr:hypothetical protein [Lachnospiraceae bacterium]
MERDRKIEKELIEQLALHEKNEKFIISSLRLMDNDSKRIALIEYLKKHKFATRQEIETTMFYMTIETR